MGEGGEYFPILKLISMGLLKNMVLEPLWSGNGYGFSLLMVLHRVWLSRQTKNHVFVFSTSNGLTETWKYQSKYKQFELNYQIDIADFWPQHLHNWQKSYLHHKTQHFRSLLRKKEKKLYGLWSDAENGTFFSGTRQKKKLSLRKFRSPQISQTTISQC